MSDSKNKDIENFLLNNDNFENFITKKVEHEFNSILINEENQKPKVIKDFSKLPKDEIFSKNTTYELINKSVKTKSFINGVQAEGFLGAENLIREKLLLKQIDSFVSGDYYIKFYSFEK